MGTIGWPELLLIFGVVLLVFGVGRIARVGGELGKGVSAFREGLKDGQEPNGGSESSDTKEAAKDEPVV